MLRAVMHTLVPRGDTFLLEVETLPGSAGARAPAGVGLYDLPFPSGWKSERERARETVRCGGGRALVPREA